MTTWNDWTSPTIEEIAACFPDLEREILGRSFGSSSKKHPLKQALKS